MGFLKFLQCGGLSLSAYSLVIKRVYFKRYCFSRSLKVFQPYSTEIMYKMKSVYFQWNEEDAAVRVNLNFSDENSKRAFHFDRPILESLDTFLNRVQIRLQTSINKKNKKKKTFEKPVDLPDMKVCLLLNNEVLPGELKFQDIFQNYLNRELKLRINDADYDVFLNYPFVKKMALSKKLYAGTIAFPETMMSQFMDEEKSEFTWYISKTPQKMKNWNKCGEGFFYFIKEEDIGYYLKLVCIPKMGEKVGPVSEIVSTESIMEFNALEEIKKRHEFTKEATGIDEFRIVSYNILAVTYTQTKEAKTELFTFCNPVFLDFIYRKTLCLTELLGYKADIICLQEVDESHHSTLELFFTKANYACIYNEKEGTKEGCSLIYNKSKFNILSAQQYIFSKELFNNPLLEHIKVKVQENENLVARLNGISSQIQVVALESSSNQIIIVGNTHFYFHPDADHVRLLQGVVSWHILQNTFEDIKKKQPNKKCSILLCGDLNSTPDSVFHQFLTTGSVDSNNFCWKSKEDEAIEGLSCQHSFKVSSAYDNTQFTNYTPLFKGCLDYIYYQIDNLKLKQTVPIPSEEVLSRFGGIPSEFFPSDHVALVADFKFEE